MVSDSKGQSDSAAGKKLVPMLREVLDLSEGNKLLLMSATPMYNTYKEIISLLNLLLYFYLPIINSNLVIFDFRYLPSIHYPIFNFFLIILVIIIIKFVVHDLFELGILFDLIKAL